MKIEANETKRVSQAYKRRSDKRLSGRYSFFQKGHLQHLQERERVLLDMLSKFVGESLSDKRVLDIGCGRGGTLLPMLLYGFKPSNCFGVDILEDRITDSRALLPNMTFACCSAEEIPFEKGSFDLVTMFTCLSSVLDKEIRARICRQAKEMLKPGGVVLIYDVRVNNPANKDVSAVALNEQKKYFHGFACSSRTLTVLPPLGRLIGRYSGSLCGALALVPFLRTHRMTIFQKPLHG